jgi:hypothetical protein
MQNRFIRSNVNRKSKTFDEEDWNDSFLQPRTSDSQRSLLYLIDLACG